MGLYKSLELAQECCRSAIRHVCDNSGVREPSATTCWGLLALFHLTESALAEEGRCRGLERIRAEQGGRR